MKIIFLGTGTSTGVPVIGCSCEVCQSKDPRDQRTRTSLYIETEDKKIVIDTGPDFRSQLLRENIHNIDAVLYTHPHRDHTAGLDDIRPINYLNNKRIDVFLNKETELSLKKQFAYIFEDTEYPGLPLIDMYNIEKEMFTIGKTQFLPIPVKHGKSDVLGFRFNDVCYVTDVNYIPKESMQIIKGCKVLIISAIHHQKHYSHFHLEEALEVIKEIQPQKVYLIHMSHKMGLHEKVSKNLPENVYLSYDGHSFSLDL